MPDFSFALTFAGIPFVEDRGVRMQPAPGEIGKVAEDLAGPCPDLIDEIDRLHPFRYGKEWVFPEPLLSRSQNALAVTADRVTPDVKINEWYYPFGASRWSVFRGLMTSDQLRYVLLNCGYAEEVPPSAQTVLGLAAATFTMLSAPFNFNNLGGLPDNYLIQTPMRLLPPKPLAENGVGYDGLYLITLVDARYYFQGTPVSLSITQFTTWKEIIQQLADTLGIVINDISDFQSEAVYGKPQADSQLWSRFEQAAPLLDAAVANVGRVLVREFDGSYSMLTADQSWATALTNRGQVSTILRNAGGDYFSSGTRLNVGVSGLYTAKNAAVPTEIIATYTPYVEGDDPVPHIINSRYRNQRPSAWYEDGLGAGYEIIVPIASGGQHASGLIGVSQLTLRDTAKALLSGEIQFQSGKAINHSGLHALALKTAQDYYGWQLAIALDESYPGTAKWSPEGHHDIVWTYSTRRRLASTRVFRSPWSQCVENYQRAQVEMSGLSNTPRGVGGPSVAQSIKDSYGASGSYVGSSGFSGGICTYLWLPLNSGDTYAIFSGIDQFPTYNRWRGRILSVDPNDLQSGLQTEIILFEGTSGGGNAYTPPSGTSCSGGFYSGYTPTSGSSCSGTYYTGTLLNSGGGFRVDIALREIDGTRQPLFHANGSLVTQVLPDASYGVNLTSYEQMQFTYPHEWTSGGIQGARIVPQTQTVQVLDGVGVVMQDMTHYSGRINTYDPTQGLSGNWQETTYVWVIERNDSPVAGSGLLLSGPLSGGFLSGYLESGAYYSGSPYSGFTFSGFFFSGTALSGQSRVYLDSGTRYAGQLLGYSTFISGKADQAPIYGTSLAGMGGDEAGFWAVLVGKTPNNNQFAAYTYKRATDSDAGGPISWAQDTEETPAYEVNDIDLPVLSLPSAQNPSAPSFAPPVVRMHEGQGNYKLFDQQPRWEDIEIVNRSGITIGASTYYPGNLLRYDQTSKVFCRRYPILVLIATDIEAQDC